MYISMGYRAYNNLHMALKTIYTWIYTFNFTNIKVAMGISEDYNVVQCPPKPPRDFTLILLT